MTLLLAIVFLGYVLFNAFDPQGLAIPIAPGSLTTWWFVYGIALIIGSWLLSVIYVVLANRAARRTLSALAALLTLTQTAQAAEAPHRPRTSTSPP